MSALFLITIYLNTLKNILPHYLIGIDSQHVILIISIGYLIKLIFKNWIVIVLIIWYLISVIDTSIMSFEISIYYLLLYSLAIIHTTHLLINFINKLYNFKYGFGLLILYDLLFNISVGLTFNWYITIGSLLLFIFLEMSSFYYNNRKDRIAYYLLIPVLPFLIIRFLGYLNPMVLLALLLVPYFIIAHSFLLKNRKNKLWSDTLGRRTHIRGEYAGAYHISQKEESTFALPNIGESTPFIHFIYRRWFFLKPLHLISVILLAFCGTQITVNWITARLLVLILI